jgi:multiple sugar transport system permease protein
MSTGSTRRPASADDRPAMMSARASVHRPGSLATVYVLAVVTFVCVPLVWASYLAFTEYHGFLAPELTGLDNLREAAADPLLGTAIRNTLLLVLLVVPVRLVLAVGLALMLARERRGHGAVRAMVLLPSVIPDTAWALVWLWILNPQFGPLSALTGHGFGLLTEPWPTRIGIALMLSFQVGESFVICLIGRRLVPHEIYEAAAVEGASPWFVTRRITLPALGPLLALVVLRDVVLVASVSFVAVLLVTNGGPRESTVTLPLYLYSQGFRYGDLGLVSAVSLVAFAVTAVVVIPAATLLARRRLMA